MTKEILGRGSYGTIFATEDHTVVQKVIQLTDESMGIYLQMVAGRIWPT